MKVTLFIYGVQEGETSPVDVLLAIIGEEGEDISALISGNADATKEAPKAEETANKETDYCGSNCFEADLPDGVQVITMPRLSDTMTDGTVATWLKESW